MATLRPFQALRPRPEHVEEVACPPYDVISADEARSLADGLPLSFLHVIRPEIDLPPGTDEHEDRVYDTGARNLQRFRRHPAFTVDDAPSLYVYRLVWDGRAQTGLFGCVSVDAYDQGDILKHENTRPDKEDDRTRHILTQRAHAEPVMLTYRDAPSIDDLVEDVTAGDPLFDLTADEVRHTVWKAPDAAAFTSAFAGIDRLYVADGHHRCKAASRAAEALRNTPGDATPDDEEHRFFPAVLFPMSQMRILAYNRLVHRLDGSPAGFLERLDGRFTLQRNAPPIPAARGSISLYLDGAWYGLRLPASNRTTVADRLDVARLSEFLLEPLLGIHDPRTDPNLSFVGGIRGTTALEDAVDSGRAALAVSLYPTAIEELLAVSDAGLLMPPKSTWFEPKLRSGLLVHLFV